ncbi:hypothetical protein Tco_0701947 [Tanacetum coccineum]|uniref:Uncharacterized protein n=1 Tax=Tanacetum coccineum TaxID=301880 RepID=A0ABQ4XW80_9ASTR
MRSLNRHTICLFLQLGSQRGPWKGDWGKDEVGKLSSIDSAMISKEPEKDIVWLRGASFCGLGKVDVIVDGGGGEDINVTRVTKTLMHRNGYWLVGPKAEAGNVLKVAADGGLLMIVARGSESKGSKQTEEVDHKESGDIGKGKEAAATGFGETDK